MRHALHLLAALPAGFMIPPAAAASPTDDNAVGALELAYPFPSPDGATVVFQGNFDGRWQLYRMRSADGAIRRLHVSGRDDTHPAVSPDGEKIAFISNRDGNDEVYLLDLESGAVRSVAPHPGKDGHPKWSADGEWIVFNRTFDPTDVEGDRDSAIMRVRADGSDLELLSDSPRIETFPSFSPDGRAIAFVEWFPDDSGRPARNGDIIVVDLATRRRTNVTASPEFDGYPFWSPVGDWIYFSAAADGPDGREARVFRVRPDGTAREPVTSLDGRSEVRAVATADGSTLYFNRTLAGQTLIFRMSLARAASLSPGEPDR